MSELMQLLVELGLAAAAGGVGAVKLAAYRKARAAKKQALKDANRR